MAESLHILLGTSACLQWLCHSGERTVARGPLVYYYYYYMAVQGNLMNFLCIWGLNHCIAGLGGSVGCAVRLEGSTPAEVDNILSWRLIMKYFLSLPLIQKGQLSVSGESMCTILVNRLED